MSDRTEESMLLSQLQRLQLEFAADRDNNCQLQRLQLEFAADRDNNWNKSKQVPLRRGINSASCNDYS
ncbi:hypothetical protein J6590_075186 [Homalodisca vitripennis]|nr:hypothetical protein J6590_075186 [Homalodisca vitripennis]